MNRILRIILLSLLLASHFLGSARPGYACSCLPPVPPQDAMSEAAVVFAGQVTNVAPAAGDAGGPQLIPVTFEVSQVWKGSADAQMTVRTERDSAACGYPFEAGREYIVYAYLGDNLLQTNLCSRTAPIENADEDLAALGEGQPPAQGEVQPPAPTAPPLSWPCWHSLPPCWPGAAAEPPEPECR
jgi:hypothetical protein